VFEDILILRI